jgi:hypothetical protein
VLRIRTGFRADERSHPEVNALPGLDLLTGALPAIVDAAAGIAALYLLVRKGRAWWTAVAGATAAATMLALAADWILVNVSATTAHDLPWPVTAWIGVAVLAVELMVLNLCRTRRRRKVLAPVAMTALILGAALQTNAYFGTYRTLGDFTGASTAGITALPPEPGGSPPAPLQPAAAAFLDETSVIGQLTISYDSRTLSETGV